MRHRISLLILAFFCSSAHAQRGPQEVVNDFYAARLGGASAGSPSGRELAEYSMHLGPELVCVLGAALRYNESFAEAHPEAKSAFTDGDLYSSNAEIPARFSLGKLRTKGNSASLTVDFSKDLANTQDHLDWTDTVHLNLVSKRWRITDIEYQGTFESAKKGRLFSSLKEALHAAEPVPGWSVKELESCTMDKVAPKKNKPRAKTRSAVKKSSKPVKR